MIVARTTSRALRFHALQITVHHYSRVTAIKHSGPESFESMSELWVARLAFAFVMIKPFGLSFSMDKMLFGRIDQLLEVLVCRPWTSKDSVAGHDEMTIE